MYVPNGVSAEYRNESVVREGEVGGLFALKQEPQNSGLLELLNLGLERLLFFSFFSLSLFLNVFSFSLSSPLRRFFTQPVCVSRRWTYKAAQA